MTDQQNTAPAVWDPTARGGAGGWVRGPQQPAPGTAQPPTAQPPAAQPVPPAPGRPGEAPQAPGRAPLMQQPPAAGGVGDQGPPLAARPYLATGGQGYDAPTAPAFPAAAPPPAGPPTAAPPAPGFPEHAAPQGPAGGYGYPPAPQPQNQPHPPPQPPYAEAPYPQQYPGYPAQPYQQPYQQPDYAAGYEDLDAEDRPANRRAPLLIAFALLFVLALGGGILWAVKGKGDSADRAAATTSSAAATDPGTTGNPPPAPAPDGSTGAPSPTDTASASASASPTAGAGGPNAQAQAKALDELLTQGESAKAPIGSAVAKVSSCPAKADIDSAAQVFDSGAKQRDQLIAKLATLAVTDLPGGADAVQSLKSAWQLSADIDRAYASWARAVSAQGCSGSAPNTADKKHADELNPQATQAKKDFVAKWKAIADPYGLTARTQDRI